MANLTESQKQRISNINTVITVSGTIGLIGGIIYAHRTGGGFWRYIGYSILGNLVFSLPAYVISTPFKNKILKESETKIAEPIVDIPEKKVSKEDYIKSLQKEKAKSIANSMAGVLNKYKTPETNSISSTPEASTFLKNKVNQSAPIFGTPKSSKTFNVTQNMPYGTKIKIG